jgi:hypothetical protein
VNRTDGRQLLGLVAGANLSTKKLCERLAELRAQATSVGIDEPRVTLSMTHAVVSGTLLDVVNGHAVIDDGRGTLLMWLLSDVVGIAVHNIDIFLAPPSTRTPSAVELRRRVGAIAEEHSWSLRMPAASAPMSDSQRFAFDVLAGRVSDAADSLASTVDGAEALSKVAELALSPDEGDAAVTRVGSVLVLAVSSWLEVPSADAVAAALLAVL